MSEVEVRPITPDELAAFFGTFTRGMHFPPFTAEALDRTRSDFVYDRTLAAIDSGQIVGTTYSHDFELTVPGRCQIGAAGVTAVSVLSTHRRRRVLTTLMERQLKEAHARGEPLTILIASESVIYGRFGYGVSSQVVDTEIDTSDGAFRSDAPLGEGRIVLVDEESADKIFPDLYERWRRNQPGAIPRNDVWWDQVAADRKPGTHTHLIYENADGTVDGYLRYSVASKWERGLAASNLEEQDFVTMTPQARCALWRHTLDVDLVRKVSMGAQPVDDPVRWWLANPRAMRVNRVGDHFWTRILDVAKSLAARTYRLETELVFDVTDPLLGDGTYLLQTATNGSASCEPTTRDADLALGIAELGSIYLGGFAASDVASGGRIRELTDGALGRADAAFSSAPKPWSATWF
jgi:predicted acetyltransferase